MTAVAPLAWDGESRAVDRQRGRRPVGRLVAHQGQAARERADVRHVRRHRPALAGRPEHRAARLRSRAGPVAREDRVRRVLRRDRATFSRHSRMPPPPCNPYSYMLYNTGSVWTETVSPTLIAGRQRRGGDRRLRRRTGQPGQVGRLHRSVTTAHERGASVRDRRPRRTGAFEEEAMTTDRHRDADHRDAAAARRVRPQRASTLHRAEARGAWVLMAPYCPALPRGGGHPRSATPSTSRCRSPRRW